MTRNWTFLFLVFLIGFCSFKSSDPDYVLTIQKGIVTKQDKTTYWVIPTTLTNNSKDTLKYFSMSCSWQDFYSVDNRKLQIETPICDKNVPAILTLAPRQKKTVKIRLIISQTMEVSEIRFKIGFNLIKVDKWKAFFDYDYKEEQKKKNVIWSNLIQM